MGALTKTAVFRGRTPPEVRPYNERIAGVPIGALYWTIFPMKELPP